MIRKFHWTTVVCAAVLAASPSLAGDFAPVDARPAAMVAISAPPAGKGQIFFFRHSNLMSAAYWAKVRENGVELGKLGDGVYFVEIADPGAHTYTAAIANKEVLRLQVAPGETYFVEGRASMGIVGYNITLTPSDEAAFQQAARRMRRVATPAELAPPAPPAK